VLKVNVSSSFQTGGFSSTNLIKQSCEKISALVMVKRVIVTGKMRHCGVFVELNAQGATRVRRGGFDRLVKKAASD
jgi:hypothetical protein